MSLHVRERLSAYMDGELPRGDRSAIEVHLRECPDCARHLEELAALDDQARALPVDAPEGHFESFPGRVRSRLAAQVRPTRWRPPVWSWAAAAALLLAVLTPLTYRSAAVPQAAPRSEDQVAQKQPAPADGGASTAPIAPPATFLDAGSAPPPPAVVNGAPAFEARRQVQPEPKKAPLAPAPAATMPPSVYAEAERETRERLRALGYVGPAERTAPGTGGGAAPRPATPARPTEAPPAAQASGRFASPPPLSEERAGRENEGVAAGEKRAKARQGRDEDSLKKKAEVDKTPQGVAETVTVTGESPAVSTTAAQGTVSGDLASGRKDEPKRPEPATEDLTVSARSSGSGARRFAALGALPAPRTVAEARSRRDAWRALVRADPGAPEADEARVRALEAGAEVYRLGGDAKELAAVRGEVAAYLGRPDAAQAERVKALLRTLPQAP